MEPEMGAASNRTSETRERPTAIICDSLSYLGFYFVMFSDILLMIPSKLSNTLKRPYRHRFPEQRADQIFLHRNPCQGRLVTACGVFP